MQPVFDRKVIMRRMTVQVILQQSVRWFILVPGPFTGL